MRISEISVEMTKETRRYENIKIRMTATVAEHEDGPAAADKLVALVEWKINEPARLATLRTIVEQLDTLDALPLDELTSEQLAERDKLKRKVDWFDREKAKADDLATEFGGSAFG